MNTESPVVEPGPEPEGPDAIGFDPPAPLFLVTEENVAITEPLFEELSANMRVAIPDPWSKTENYIIGVVRGLPGKWMLDVGSSLGKLELTEDGWKCLGLARMNAIAQGLAIETAGVPAPPKSFTARLIKRSGRAWKKQR